MKVTPVQLRSVILRETRRALREAYGDIAPSREEQERVNPPAPKDDSDMDILGDTEITELCGRIASMVVQHAIDVGVCEYEDAPIVEDSVFYSLTEKVEEVWEELKTEDYTGLQGKVW